LWNGVNYNKLEAMIWETFQKMVRHKDLQNRDDPFAGLPAGSTGKIELQSCFIVYRLGENARGRYLDFYSDFKFSVCMHTRIFNDGTVINLAAPMTFVRVGKDIEESKKIKDAYFRRNKSIGKLLKKKFGQLS